MYRAISLVIFFLFASFCQSLSQSQEVKVEKTFGGYKFIYQQKSLRMKDFVNVVSVNPDAAVYADKAKSGYGLASALAFGGGFLIGWPLGTAIGGGDPNWTLAAAGAGLVIIGIPVNSAAMNNAKEAANIYNNGLKNGYSHFEIPEASILIQGPKLGIYVRF